VGVVAGIPRWHARGQGFKSPQLHRAQRFPRSPAQGRLPENCQSLTISDWQSTLSADRLSRLGSFPHPRSIVRTSYTEAQGRPCGRPPEAVALALAATPWPPGTCLTDTRAAAIAGRLAQLRTRRPALHAVAPDEQGRHEWPPNPPGGAELQPLRLVACLLRSRVQRTGTAGYDSGAMRPLIELAARNFRSLREVEVPLQPVNVLVGPNNSGKSTFLDLIGFLGDSVRTDLIPALSRRGGYDRLRFRGKSSGRVEIHVKANVTAYSSLSAPDEYSLMFRESKLSRRPRSYIIRDEEFKFKRTKGRGRRITVDGADVTVSDISEAGPTVTDSHTIGLQKESLGLATLPRLSDKEGGREIRRVAELFATFRIFDIDVNAARLPSPMGTNELEEDASNLAAFLFYLRGETDRFDELEEDACAMIPGLESIEFESVGGPTDAVAVRLREKGLSGLTDLADASYGSIRILALLALLYDPAPPKLTCVEEIDHGLHPYLFDRLVERVREASDHTQFLIATHSPALVNRLKPDELIVCERGTDGASRIPAIDSRDVRRLEDDFEGGFGLGELWFAGTLGGVPE
jgi:predicted ATPase